MKGESRERPPSYEQIDHCKHKRRIRPYRPPPHAQVDPFMYEKGNLRSPDPPNYDVK